MMAHTFNPSTKEIETGRSLKGSRLTWTTKSSRPNDLHNETLSQKKKWESRGDWWNGSVDRVCHQDWPPVWFLRIPGMRNFDSWNLSDFHLHLSLRAREMTVVSNGGSSRGPVSQHRPGSSQTSVVPVLRDDTLLRSLMLLGTQCGADINTCPHK